MRPFKYLLLAILIFAGGCRPPAPLPSATPQATAIASNTSIPTGAPLHTPTPTQRLNTPTLKPTRSPAPTRTASPTPTATPAPVERSLELVGQVFGSAQTVAVQGSTVYLGVGPRLEILSADNPSQPVKM